MISLKGQKLIYLCAYILIASIIVYFLKPIYLISLLIVILPPTIANYIWLKESKRKIMIFSILATIFFAPAIELIGRLSNIWDVQTTFPKLLGLIPLENMIFAFLNFIWVLSFYEYFIDKNPSKKFSKRFTAIIFFFIFFSTITFTTFFINKNILILDYHKIAIPILLIPAIMIYAKNLHLLKKTIYPILFFCFVFGLYEIIAILIGNWWWPGTYIFPINIIGNVFPLDDIFIWFILSTITLIGGYEFFVDNYK